MLSCEGEQIPSVKYAATYLEASKLLPLTERPTRLQPVPTSADMSQTQHQVPLICLLLHTSCLLHSTFLHHPHHPQGNCSTILKEV